MSKKKKTNRIWICMQSSESTFRRFTEKRRVVGHKLSLRKYDPIVRKYTTFNEVK